MRNPGNKVTKDLFDDERSRLVDYEQAFTIPLLGVQITERGDVDESAGFLRLPDPDARPATDGE